VNIVSSSVAFLFSLCSRYESIAGAYLSLPEPFAKGASIRIKIRTRTEFFQADARSYIQLATWGWSMFHAVSPPFLIVLHGVVEAQQEVYVNTTPQGV